MRESSLLLRRFPSTYDAQIPSFTGVESRGSLLARDVRDRIRFRLYRVYDMTALLAAVTLGALGCSDDKRPTPPTPEDPRKTIPGVMQELTDAYEARDIDRYTKLFDTDSFMFVFDSLDVLENPNIPPNWEWSEEHRSAENMFEDSLLARIQLDFTVETPVSPAKNDVGHRPFPEGTMKVTLRASRSTSICAIQGVVRTSSTSCPASRLSSSTRIRRSSWTAGLFGRSSNGATREPTT
jgi:hypothetical protein